MNKPWLKHYPVGVPEEIDPTQYETVARVLEEAMQKYAARTAFICMGKSITYAQIDTASRGLGAWLQSRGIAPGGRVAIMMPNIMQYPVAVAAILRAGYVVVNVNPLYTPRELEHQLKDSGAEAIVIIENFATTLEKVIANTPVKHVVVAAMGDLLGGFKGTLVNFVVRRVKKMVPEFSLPGSLRFNDAVAQGSGMTLKTVPRTRDDVAFLQYTGGTTGVSKGATLLNRNIVANMLQVEEWMQPAINTHTDEQHNFVCALPLYHIFALTVCNMIGMRTGSCNLLIPNPRDIPGFVKELSTFKFNVFPCLNTLFNALANNPEFAKLDFSTLKISLGGGMATQRPVAEKWMALTGSAIVEGYGLSETSPVATCNVSTLKGFTGTIGLPVSSTEIAIRDDNGANVPLGESGEICIRGPQVMAGYWQRPDETANVMTADGFFKSGDVGIMDETGATRIVDRKKDMVLVSGFNVYPSEIEEVAMKCPGVMEAAVIGVPDEHSGEVPKIFIVKKDPALTEQVVQDFLKENLTGYKRPKYVEFRADLPKTPVGKILRRELRPKS
ncbi:long-chain-fatty-acid--CoA ligase [Sulfuritalea hydrogenivorans]|uniref:Long-chain-fatty-acid--CoA ligase n=1 Tax=Sulfuritalea hydrogenivorans sk43H TaxID=1223802 RepID=W0SB01_9PROT|nr:long-chain-fatty-acid--CoA ligase [Sulfuritalea hydrogenivorans]MDK9713969.1 long-chain-fatty-acid--CoA ligase [Sulfuritalea sp.]BAO28067.1 long-chain-fatty-acid--CoA ligase [Sulfuritalea hydrogenivorans sk43H]